MPKKSLNHPANYGKRPRLISSSSSDDSDSSESIANTENDDVVKYEITSKKASSLVLNRAFLDAHPLEQTSFYKRLSKKTKKLEIQGQFSIPTWKDIEVNFRKTKTLTLQNLYMSTQWPRLKAWPLKHLSLVDCEVTGDFLNKLTRNVPNLVTLVLRNVAIRGKTEKYCHHFYCGYPPRSLQELTIEGPRMENYMTCLIKAWGAYNLVSLKLNIPIILDRQFALEVESLHISTNNITGFLLRCPKLRYFTLEMKDPQKSPLGGFGIETHSRKKTLETMTIPGLPPEIDFLLEETQLRRLEITNPIKDPFEIAMIDKLKEKNPYLEVVYPNHRYFGLCHLLALNDDCFESILQYLGLVDLVNLFDINSRFLDAFQFIRQFPTTVHFNKDNQWLLQSPYLKTICARLKRVTIRDFVLEQSNRLIPMLPKLDHLELAGHFSCTKSFPKLRSLILNKCPGSRTLKSLCHHLKDTLEHFDCPVSDLEPLQEMKKLKSLKILWHGYYNVQENREQLLQSILSNNKNLESMSLVVMSNFNFNFFEDTFKDIKELHIATSVFDGWPLMTNVVSLELLGYYQSKNHLRLVRNFPSLDKLTFRITEWELISEMKDLLTTLPKLMEIRSEFSSYNRQETWQRIENILKQEKRTLVLNGTIIGALE